MIDLGVSKLALIAVVALVVVGPERLPKVARMAGTLLGRAQRYMAEVKSEVNRQVELEELKQMQDAAKSAVNDVKNSFDGVAKEASSHLNEDYQFPDHELYGLDTKKQFRQGRNSWGVKKTAMPEWYKRTAGIKTKIQSGAARVKRFRRAASVQRSTKSFF